MNKNRTNPISKFIYSIKMDIESRKNWEEKMRDPIRAFPLTDDELKALKLRHPNL